MPIETDMGHPRVEVVRVALPVPLYREFDYRVPEGSRRPAPGDRVRAPFSGRTLTGVCTEVQPADPWPDARPYQELPDAAPLLGSELLELARWLSEYYHHPLGEVFATCLPGLARQQLTRPRVERAWKVVSRADTDALLARSPRQRALVGHLARIGPATTGTLVQAGFAPGLLRSLQARGLIETASHGVSDRLHRNETEFSGEVPQLTYEQQRALEAITAQRSRFQAFLLQGITGSGKTEVYLRAMAYAVLDGGQALLLVPEIGLTPQTIGRVRARFPDAVILHSALGDLERAAAQEACRTGQTRVLVGTRSAVFTQFPALRLIIVDEEHDSSYKQQDGLRYSARDVAVKRGMTLGIPVLLGSATPSFESLHNVRRGRYQALYLRSRPGGVTLPPLHILDTRGLPLEDGLAADMIRRMRRHLDAGSQVLTYVNRRGFAPVLLCSTCNWVAECPHCDSRMTTHRTPPGLVCHHCGHRSSLPTRCPDGHTTLLPLGTGTQRTEEALARIFGSYPVIRIDRDSTRNQNQLDEHLARIATGAPMLLIGTQMLAKGHHFPAVTLVVIINADGGFLSPDFRAPERTAQTIIQVAGRAGRAERPGEVWIQSLQPENPALQTLVESGYERFANEELDRRISAGLPPASAMAIIRADALERSDAISFLESLKSQIDGSVQVSGPAPAPIQRIANRHRQQLLLLAANRALLQRACLRLRTAPAPRALRWSIDIDPYDSA